MLALVTATQNSMATLPSMLTSIAEVRDRIKSIFIDGKSTDGTLEYLQSYVEKTENAVLLNENSSGLYQALNQGVQVAVSDPDVTHIGMLHGDDCLLGSNFAGYLSCIESGQADIYYSDIQFHNTTGYVVRKWRSGRFSKLKLNTGWMPPHTSMIVAKNIYREFGTYDPKFETSADYEWIVRILSARPDSISYFPRRTLSMLIGGASSASISIRIRANKMDGRVWSRRSRVQGAMIRVLKPIRKISQFIVAKELKRRQE